jgi:phosphopantetheinyl transferase (holo-ACP synthase)
VVGLGVDLAHQPRLLRAYSKFGDRFLARAFHPREAQRVRELAGRGMGDVTRQQVGDFLASRYAPNSPPRVCVAGMPRLFSLWNSAFLG